MRDDRTFGRAMNALGVLVALLLIAGPARGKREVELTFDDADDGQGVATGHAALDNMETKAAQFGAGVVSATLAGTARRSAYDEGRYGRAADLDGEGTIELDGWEARPVSSWHFWLRPRRVDRGSLVRAPGAWEVALESGALVVRATRPGGFAEERATGLAWPSDDLFHHVGFVVRREGAGLEVAVSLDFSLSSSVFFDFSPGPPEGPMALGDGLDALLDELLVNSHLPGTDLLLDRNPDYCPGPSACLEETLRVHPREFPRDVPVRVKVLWDPLRCHEASPCRLLVDVSGGNKCADDYDSLGPLAAFVDEGFVVAAVDLYCEGDDETRPYPTETSQLVAATEHVQTTSAASALVAEGDLVASGGSHGAGAVLHWALREEHHPSRTYARSGGSSGLCTFVSGVLCPDVVEHALEPFGGEFPDFSDPVWQPLHEGADHPGMITPEIADTREIALSWGVNTQGSVCSDSGAVACAEEGLWGMDYTGRRFRTLWQRAELPFAPTGYFVQDESGDCVHTAGPASEAFRCGLCFLADGRQGMEDSCSECLSYTDPTISEGGEAEACHLETPWYEDPIAVSDPGPPPGPWLEDLDLPGFRSKVRISTVDTVITGQPVEPCIDETLCVAGALAHRAELFVRVVGPKPNGKLWPTLVKFSTSRVEVWIEQLSTGVIRYYDLPAVAPGQQILELDGLADKEGFDP